MIVIDKDFQKIQDMVLTENSQDKVNCVKCTDGDGKIAAAAKSRVYIFAPKHNNYNTTDNASHEIFYTNTNEYLWNGNNEITWKWEPLHEIELTYCISELVWDYTGISLIVSHGVYISKYKFERENVTTCNLEWRQKNSSPCDIIDISSDGLFIATLNLNEKFVKVWYSMSAAWNSNDANNCWSKITSNAIQSNLQRQQLMMTYLAHPCRIISISWRKKSHYCNTDAICNVLLTTGNDKVGRIWSENLWDMKAKLAIGQSTVEDIGKLSSENISTLYNGLPKRIWPYPSFHTTIVINEASVISKKTKTKIRFHWFNNKEAEVTAYASFLFGPNGLTNPPTNLSRDCFTRAIIQWHVGPDIIYSVSAINGSFLTWSIDHLDTIGVAQSHTPSVYLNSAIATELPAKLARNIVDCIVHHRSESPIHLAARNRTFRTDWFLPHCGSTSVNLMSHQMDQIIHSPEILLNQITFIYSIHLDGSLNAWNVEYSDHKSFSCIHNISHYLSLTGITGKVVSMSTHPLYPLVIVIVSPINDKSFRACLYIWRMIPIIYAVNTRDTWMLQGWIKFIDALPSEYISWVPVTTDVYAHVVYFLILTSSGITVFSMKTSEQESCFKHAPYKLMEIRAKLCGVSVVDVIANSWDHSVSFISSQVMAVTNDRLSVEFNEAIDEIIILSAVEYTKTTSFVHVWEISFHPKKTQSRFHVVRMNSSVSDSCSIDKQMLRLYSRYIGKFSYDLGGDYPISWYDLTNRAYNNQFEAGITTTIGCRTKLDDLYFIDIVVTFPGQSFVVESQTQSFQSIQNDTALILHVFTPSVVFDGLKHLLDALARHETPLSISFSASNQMAYLALPTDSSTISGGSRIKKMFVLRIFANRLAGVESWKQETCLLIPFTDVSLTHLSSDFIRQQSNSAAFSWCSLENGDNLLSLVFLHKIFIFSPCPQISADETTDISPFPSSVTYQQRGTSSWTLLSISNCTLHGANKYTCAWMIGGVFLCGSGDSINIYSPLNSDNIVQNDNLSEIGTALNSAQSKPPLNITTLLCLVLNDNYALINMLFSKLMHSVQSAGIVPIKRSEASYVFSSELQTEKPDVVFITSPLTKLNELISCLVPTCAKDKTVFDLNALDVDIVVVENEETNDVLVTAQDCENLANIIENVNISNLTSVDVKLLPQFLHVHLQMAKIEGIDAFSRQYLYIARFQERVDNCQLEVVKQSRIFICGFHFLCAYLSNTQVQLIEYLGLFSRPNITWACAKTLGLGYWVKDDVVRKKLLETLAKNAYQQNQEPLDAALFYVLLKKKSIISALYKSRRNDKMYKFFVQDFEQSEVQVSALKNAYHLLSIHRYFHAVAFFTIASHYAEAIQVCINNLKDPQLGYLIATTFHTEHAKLINDFVMNYFIGPTPETMNNDVFIRCLGYLLLNQPLAAIMTLVEKPSVSSMSKSVLNLLGAYSHDVINRMHQLFMFSHLKSHHKVKESLKYIESNSQLPYYKAGVLVTRAYLKSSHERLLCSCVKFALNQGHIHLATLISISHQHAPECASTIDEYVHMRNSRDVRKNLAFKAFVRVIVEEIKSESFETLADRITKQLLVFDEVFLQHLPLSSPNYNDRIQSITSRTFNYIRDFAILYKFHTILHVITRHIALYHFQHAKLLAALLIISTEISTHAQKITINMTALIPIHPAFICPITSAAFVVNFPRFLSCLSRNLLSRLLKISPVLYYDKNHPLYAEACSSMRNNMSMAQLLSDILFMSLGGWCPKYFLESLSDLSATVYYFNEVTEVYLDHDIDKFMSTIDVKTISSMWPDTIEENPNQINTSLIIVYEVFLVIIATNLIQSILVKNPVTCQNFMDLESGLLSKWSTFFGGLALVNVVANSYIPSKNGWKDHKAININLSSHVVSTDSLTGKVHDMFVSPTHNILDYLTTLSSSSTPDTCSYIVEYDTEEQIANYNYAWSIMISGILCRSMHSIKSFLRNTHLATNRIFSYSDIIHSVIVYFNKIRCVLMSNIDAAGNPPRGFLPIALEQKKSNTTNEDRQLKIMKAFINPTNTPFQSIYLAEDAKLWNFLAQDRKTFDELLLFSYHMSETAEVTNDDPSSAIIYNDPKGVYSFCNYKLNPANFIIATHSALIEIRLRHGNISSISDWEKNNHKPKQSALNLYLADMKLLPQNHPNYHDNTTAISENVPLSMPITVGKETIHPISSTYMVESHPFDPYYLACVNETRVCLYQFGLNTHLHQFNIKRKSSSKFARIRFNNQGNKFGVLDDQANLSVSLFNTNPHLVPYFHQKCHLKFGASFCFLDSSSLIATCGHSPDGFDVGIWDTLMPRRSRLICSLVSQENGCSSIAHSPLTQSLSIGSRKGGVFMFDLRKQRMLASIRHAHDNSITEMTIDRNLLASGSMDGVVKLWSISGGGLTYLQSYNIKPAVKYKGRDHRIYCLRFYERYLFISSQGTLYVKVLDRLENY